MLHKILEQIETMKQNQTGTEKFDIGFSIFFDKFSFLLGDLAQNIYLLNF